MAQNHKNFKITLNQMGPSQRKRYLLYCATGFVLVLMLYFIFNPSPTIDLNSPLFKVQCIEKEQYSNNLIEEWELCSGNLKIQQNDTRLVEYIRERHLTPPSKKEYDLTPQQPLVDAVWNNLVAKRVLELLRHKRQGFFIECGANDGQFLSNTLLMETDFEWSGLLVEADPRPLEMLIKRHRKAWIANVCLSTIPYAVKIAMLRHKDWEALSFVPKFNIWREMSDYEKFEAQCFPFFSIMSALNVFEVDYFSLDIEGAELQVLKTIPFDHIFIKIFSIEVSTSAIARSMQSFMESKGYVLDGLIRETHTGDHIYIHKTLL